MEEICTPSELEPGCPNLPPVVKHGIGSMKITLMKCAKEKCRLYNQDLKRCRYEVVEETLLQIYVELRNALAQNKRPQSTSDNMS